MNYNLTVIPGQIDDYYGRDGMDYGAMPPSILQAKFEETATVDDENVFDNFARDQIINWGPDTNKFEYEEVRGGVNRNAGMLQLRYYGQRGDEDQFYRPEHFDGFQGPEYWDPRGVTTDPDMKQMAAQAEARMRFTRFSPDSAPSITGGGLSETQTIANQQSVFKWTRDKLKVFDRQLDGRREGLRREYEHASDVPKQVVVQSYGDMVQDYALTPQRTTQILATKMIRDTRAYRSPAIVDCELAHQYRSNADRKRVMTTTANPMNGAAEAATTAFSTSDRSANYKTAGLLIADLIRAKRNIGAPGDIDKGQSADTMLRKSEPIARDLALILQAIQQDGAFASAAMTQARSQARPGPVMQTQMVVEQDKITPAHHYLNAEVIYKNVKPGGDISKVTRNVTTNIEAPKVAEQLAAKGKSAKLGMMIGVMTKVDNDTDKQNSESTFQYRRIMAPNGDKRIRMAANDGFAIDGAMSHIRGANYAKMQGGNIDNQHTEQMAPYSDNAMSRLSVAPLGNKYMRRHMDADGIGSLTETGLLTS